MFDSELLPPPPDTAPPDEVIDCLVEDLPVSTEPVRWSPVRWSEYLPDGLLADLLAQSPETADPEQHAVEALERVGGWERVIAWAQAGQIREMASFLRSAQDRNQALGAHEVQAHESVVAEVGLMLATSTRTAASRVDDAWSLCTRLPATLAALERGRITLTKARILDAETANLSAEHTAKVERLVLAKAPQQTPGQLRAATRRAALSADPAAAQERAERARRERGVRMWPELDGMATLSAHLPAADAVGVFAVLDEYARRAGAPGDERTLEARRADALVDLALGPIGFCSAGTSAARKSADPEPGDAAASSPAPVGARPRDVGPVDARPVDIRPVDVRVTIPYTALLGADDLPGELAGYGPIPAAVPGTSPPGAPGGESSPIRRRGGPWTTAPLVIARQNTSPDW